MSLSSPGYLFGFLPFAVLCFILTRAVGKRASLLMLAYFSFLFYVLAGGWFIAILFIYVIFNYVIGSMISDRIKNSDRPDARQLLIFGICIDMLLLLYFKFSDVSLNSSLVSDNMQRLVVPLGISYFTFSFIAYLVEIFQLRVVSHSFIDFLNYVLFFPKILAGPITRPSEFLPQLKNISSQGINIAFFQVIGLLAIGAFKKVCIADQLSLVVDPIFSAVNDGQHLNMLRVWYGTVAYGLQLYFDFSGYSDMAIGTGLAFGIRLPVNFNAPFKAVNIGDFWRRWHISLSNFFRDYVYIPLGGNRKDTARELLNVMIVMVLCGVWHGAGWTFVIWGAIHGIYLVIHRIWSKLLKARLHVFAQMIGMFVMPRQIMTFLFVSIAWIPFRTDSIQHMTRYFLAMLSLPSRFPTSIEWLVVAITLLLPLFIIIFLPTSQQWTGYSSADSDNSNNPAQLSNTSSSHVAQSEVASSASEKTPNNGSMRLFYRYLIVGFIVVAVLSSIMKQSVFIYAAF